MAAKVLIRDTGTATLGISVARRSRRKMKTTSTTSATESSSVCCTSAMLARIVAVRSIGIESSMPAGICARSCGRSAKTLSTVRMMLAVGCR